MHKFRFASMAKLTFKIIHFYIPSAQRCLWCPQHWMYVSLPGWKLLYRSLWFRRESWAGDRDLKAVGIEMVVKEIQVFEATQGK